MMLAKMIALVTGGSRGIGRAICVKLASLGATVGINYVANPTAAEETLAQIEARLEPLAKDGRPLSAFALEALAMARLQNGQVAPAREALVLLKNGLDTPEIIIQRADLAIATIDAGGAPGLAAIVRAQAAIPVPPPATAALPAPAAAPTRP